MVTAGGSPPVASISPRRVAVVPVMPVGERLETAGGETAVVVKVAVVAAHAAPPPLAAWARQ